LIIDPSTGNLVPDSRGLGQTRNFAIYSSTPEESKATLEVPSMNLKLNLKLIDETSCMSKNGKSKETTEDVKEELANEKKWDYAQNGADWV